MYKRQHLDEFYKRLTYSVSLCPVLNIIAYINYVFDGICLYNLMHSLNVLNFDIKNFINICFYLFQLYTAAGGRWCAYWVTKQPRSKSGAL